MRKDAERSFRGIDGVEIVTFHGIAYREIGHKYAKRLEGDGLKPFDLVPLLTKENIPIDEEELHLYANGMLKLLRDFAASGNSMENFLKRMRKRSSALSAEHNIDFNYLIERLPLYWDRILSDDSLPFDHDFYLKLYQLGRYKIPADYILVDEAQDVSPVMIAIVLAQKHAKKVFVGDSFQSIYSWRGAVNSLELLERKFNPKVCYLSRSFRCPPNVGNLADRIIRLAGATKPFVGVANSCPPVRRKTYIARTNSGLFEFCVDNLDKKICFVGGIKGYNFSELLDIRNVWGQKFEYIRNDFYRNFSGLKDLMEYADKTSDIALTGAIGIVLKYSKHNIYELIAGIRDTAVTKEAEADIVVTTAHKSKGLEWAHVELLNDFPFCSETKMERIDAHSLGEELRLLYVAVTRAQNSIQLPDEVLDYLAITEEEYRGSVRISTFDDSLFERLDTSPSALEGGEGGSDGEAAAGTPLAPCPYCGESGNVCEHRGMYRCSTSWCDFSIKAGRIISFFERFGKSIEGENLDTIVLQLLHGYRVYGLRSKAGRIFDATLHFERSEKYGWGVAFKKEEHKRKFKPRPGGGRKRSKHPGPKPGW